MSPSLQIPFVFQNLLFPSTFSTRSTSQNQNSTQKQSHPPNSPIYITSMSSVLSNPTYPNPKPLFSTFLNSHLFKDSKLLSLTPSMASFKHPIPFGSGKDGSQSAGCASGEVHVIVGPMFAGKTTALLRRIKSEVDNGRNVAMLKSSKDSRYAIDSVVTHDGIKFPCWALPDLLSFREKYGDDAYLKLDVIGIDEAQFFEDLYDFCCKAADDDGKIVIVAGLDGDYLRRSFGSVLHIIPIADTVTKLTARCELCGKRAFFTLRKTEETETELIGGADVYMPVCRHHYVNSHVVMEAARSVLESHKVNRDSLLEAAPVV